MPRIEILMSSGEVDGYTDAPPRALFEANVTSDGYLHVISPLEGKIGDPVPPGTKVIHIASEIDQGPDLPPTTKIQAYALRCTYAPGMWMKVTHTP